MNHDEPKPKATSPGLPARSRNTQARRDRARQAILEAAMREFSERGYFQVSTRDIARRAGVAVGLPYRYFASKEALVAACIDFGGRIWLDRLRRHLEEHPPRTLVDHIIEHAVCVRRFLDDDDLGIWRFYKRHVDRDDFPALAQLAQAGDTKGTFDDALDRAFARGEIREGVPRALAQFLVDMVYIDLQETLYHRYGTRDYGLGAAESEATARELLARIVSTALAGILRDATAPERGGDDG